MNESTTPHIPRWRRAGLAWEQYWFADADDVAERLGLVRLLLGLSAVLKFTGLYGLLSRAIVGHVEWGFPRHAFGKARFGFGDMPSPLWDAIPTLTLRGYRHVEELALVLACFTLLGVFSRVAQPLLGVLCLWLVTFDIAAFKHNTFTLGCACLVVGLMDSHRRFSLWRRVKGGAPTLLLRPQSILPVRLLQVWVAAIYAFTTIAKCNASWFSGTFMTYVVDKRRIDLGPLLPIASAPAVHQLLTLGVLLTEAFLAAGLLYPRTRKVALVVGVALHATLELTMDVGAFSYVMWALYAAFVPRTAWSSVLARCRSWWSSARS